MASWPESPPVQRSVEAAFDEETDDMCFPSVHFGPYGPLSAEEAEDRAHEMQRRLRHLHGLATRMLRDDVREMEAEGYRLMARFPIKKVRGPGSKVDIRVPLRYETWQTMFSNGRAWYCLNFARRKESSGSSSLRASSAVSRYESDGGSDDSFSSALSDPPVPQVDPGELDALARFEQESRMGVLAAGQRVAKGTE